MKTYMVISGPRAIFETLSLSWTGMCGQTYEVALPFDASLRLRAKKAGLVVELRQAEYIDDAGNLQTAPYDPTKE